jgi:hypothetical protein
MKHELEKIEFGIIPVTNYRGCVVYKTESGYYIFNQEVLTPADVDALIDLSLTTIQNSLTKQNKQL